MQEVVNLGYFTCCVCVYDITKHYDWNINGNDVREP